MKNVKKTKFPLKPGGTPILKGRGCSSSRLKVGVWSHLGCSGQNSIIFSRQDLV